MRQLFLDTETTGLSPDAGDRIIEIGCVEMVDRRLTGRNLHLYLNPQRRSHEDAIKVHGLTEEFLADKPLFDAVADQLLAFVANAEVIIHNAAFDEGFLNAELKRIGRPTLREAAAVNVVCTLTKAREIFPGKSNSLDALCRRFEVDNTSRTLHGALLDAGLLAEVYIRMTRGQNVLVIDAADGDGADASFTVVDFSLLQLPVIRADDAERAAHRLMLAEIQKASGGRAIWHAEATEPAAGAMA